MTIPPFSFFQNALRLNTSLELIEEEDLTSLCPAFLSVVLENTKYHCSILFVSPFIFYDIYEQFSFHY